MSTLFHDHLLQAEKLGAECAMARHYNDESTAQFIYRQYTRILSLYAGAERQTLSAAYESAYKLESQAYNPKPLYFQ